MTLRIIYISAFVVVLSSCGLHEQIRHYEKVEVFKMEYIRRLPGAIFISVPSFPSCLIDIKEFKLLNKSSKIISAEMIGGPAALSGRIVYPELAKRAGIDGVVILEFEVNEQGTTQNIILIRGIGGTCDETAIKALQSVKFEAAKENNKAITTRYSISILFEIPVEVKNTLSVIPRGFDWGKH